MHIFPQEANIIAKEYCLILVIHFEHYSLQLQLTFP